jgi:hypothetical protein
MSDSPDERSEQLDGDTLGAEPTGADGPGAIDYPPDRSYGVEDPTLIGEDDLETRATLRRDVADDPGAEVVLVDDAPVDGDDRDETVAGTGIDLRGDTGDVPIGDVGAEEAAMHVEDDDVAEALERAERVRTPDELDDRRA